MSDGVRNMILSALISGAVGWFAASEKIDQELRSRQGESGYEALVRANTLLQQSNDIMLEANQTKDAALVAEARKARRESDASYHAARQKIAAFGNDRVVTAMADYYSKHGPASAGCGSKEKFRSDIQIYKAIRNTLGVGGKVSDEALANIVFLCSLK